VGMEAHHDVGALHAYDRIKQVTKAETDRPPALREAPLACRHGGVVSGAGVSAGLVDKFPMGSLMNRSLRLRSGQCHVQRYMRPLLERIEGGDIDPSFVITHRMNLNDAPLGFDTFLNKEDGCLKVIMNP